MQWKWTIFLPGDIRYPIPKGRGVGGYWIGQGFCNRVIPIQVYKCLHREELGVAGVEEGGVEVRGGQAQARGGRRRGEVESETMKNI